MRCCVVVLTFISLLIGFVHFDNSSFQIVLKIFWAKENRLAVDLLISN
jgi:hypothetical protein